MTDVLSKEMDYAEVKAQMEWVYAQVKSGALGSKTGVEMTQILRAIQDVTTVMLQNRVMLLLEEGARKHDEMVANRPKFDTSRMAGH